IILVATAGKFGGTLAAARLTGLPWRESAALGMLMNTRGLMELIVLNIGLDLRVISPTLFAMMVLMALVTTMATTPILHLLVSGGNPQPGMADETNLRKIKSKIQNQKSKTNQNTKKKNPKQKNRHCSEHSDFEF